jgi:hypothetical protein
MPTAEFYIWRSHYEEGKFVGTAPKPVTRGFELKRGISRAKGWGKVAVHMNEEYPKDIELTDNVFGASLVVVSGRLKKALEAETGDKVEYLPVEIINHKGKPAAKDYFVVNPLGTVDCVDVKASRIEWNEFKKDMMDTCKQFVIDADRVPKNIVLFRPATAPYAIVARASLVKKLGSRFEGLEFQESLDYTGI